MELVLYSAPDCCLCGQAVQALEPLRSELGFTLRIVDISADPDLEARYRQRIPVGEVDGRVVFKFHADLERVREALRSAQPAEPRFLVDDMLGRLARWLRVLGYDAVYAAAGDDAALVARAEAEGRILLTRDRLLLERRAVRQGRVRAVLVRDDLLLDQLRQMREDLGVDADRGPRCMVCGGSLEPLSVEQARPHVPLYVAQTQSSFRRCAGCGRMMWRATHWEHIQDVLRQAGFVGGHW